MASVTPMSRGPYGAIGRYGTPRAGARLEVCSGRGWVPAGMALVGCNALVANACAAVAARDAEEVGFVPVGAPPLMTVAARVVLLELSTIALVVVADGFAVGLAGFAAEGLGLSVSNSS